VSRAAVEVDKSELLSLDACRLVDAGHRRCHEFPTTAVSTGADRDVMPADDALPLRLRIEFSCVETGAQAWR